MSTIIPATITVPYHERNDSPSERWTEDGFEATRVLKVRWENVPAFAQQALGRAIQIDDSIVRVDAWRYDSIRYGRAYAHSVDVKPFGSNARIESAAVGDRVNQYEFAQVTVNFKTREHGEEDDVVPDEDNPLADPFITEDIELGAEYLTIQSDNLRWYVTGEPIGGATAITKLIPLMEWTVTRHKLAKVPDDVFNNVGKINSDIVRSPKLDRNFAVFTVLYLGASISRDINTLGLGEFRVVLKFAIRGGGSGHPTWQQVWNQTVGDGEEVADADQNQVMIYDEAALKNVIGVFGDG